jgi:hypothetical protein
MTPIVVASTTTATTAAKAFASAATSTACARTIGLRLRLVDSKWTSAQVGSIQGGDRLIRRSRIRHFHETESARATRVAVGDQGDFFHRSMRFENVP